MAEVGGVADAIAEAVDHKAVRAKAVMSEVDWVACEAVDRREGGDVEWSDEWHEIGAAEGEAINLIGVTVDRDVQAAEGRSPVGRKVVPIEVGEAERQRCRPGELRCRRGVSASVRGPMPASMSKTPAGERRIAAFPAEPLARMQSSRDIVSLHPVSGRASRRQPGSQDLNRRERTYP